APADRAPAAAVDPAPPPGGGTRTAARLDRRYERPSAPLWPGELR
ncbi:sulfotransferase, partial [Streptomyces sp. SID3915]|nr:sulfotransferase [Streptomyces sp. SID3915]